VPRTPSFIGGSSRQRGLITVPRCYWIQIVDAIYTLARKGLVLFSNLVEDVDGAG